MKRKTALAAFTALSLALTTTVVPAHAESANNDAAAASTNNDSAAVVIDADADALAGALAFDPATQKIIVDEAALDENGVDLTASEIASINAELAQLEQSEVERALEESGQDPEKVAAPEMEEGIGLRAAPAVIPIAWKVGIAIIGILTAGALIFTAKYFSHKEKMTLINKCYDNSGYPVVDSRDKGGVEGTTDSAKANSAGGYKFECRKA
ncbi:chromosome partitioning protein ParB [Corynebacterium sp.]|uniref:chromosome partitioning protein ParB n=1 Tax=Corynebacterium sp. TaxID=1720 RepID=UPI0026DAE20C|nr:chromosome partitioning protein ParB [Corynebacterium sp.]MDO5032127.1 chromosome partitioning protein ParB [Corynebacterium sp.]